MTPPRYNRNWLVVLTITSPVAKTLTAQYREEPTENQLDAFLAREGAGSARVIPPGQNVPPTEMKS